MKIHGHRGARGRRPENTLPALEYALRHGADGVEVDVCVTKDDVVVLHHDLRLNPAHTQDANGKWIARRNPPAVRELQLKELQQYDVGHLRNPKNVLQCDAPPPTLAECIALLMRPEHANAILNLEMKGCWKYSGNANSFWNGAHAKLLPAPDKYVSLVLAQLERANIPPRRIFLQSFDWRLMYLAKQRRPELKIGLITDCKSAPPVSLPQLVKQNGGDVWSSKYTHINKSLVREAHVLGLEVCAWTVNNPRAMRRMGEWGVDVVATDFPGEMLAVMPPNKNVTLREWKFR